MCPRKRDNSTLAFEVTKAATAEQPQAHLLLDQLQQQHGTVLERGARLSADAGYDDGKLIERLWDEHQIKPIIDIRNLWKDGETSKLVAGQQNVIYTFNGEVSCMCLQSGTVRRMDYAGFERARNTLKYRCPVLTGGDCASQGKCPVGKAIRIPLANDRRVFTPVARSSYVWQDYYDQRSAVERVNSRLAGRSGSSTRSFAGWRRCGCG